MATLYQYSDAGAPALTYTTTVGGLAHFTAFKTVLKACLVSGYSGKDAAGWELIAEGASHLVLRPGSHSGYVCFTFGSNTVTIYLAATFLGMNGDVIAGDGLKTGLSAGNSPPQRIGIMWFVRSVSIGAWRVVADDRTMVFVGTGYSQGYDMETGGLAGQFIIPLYVGEDSRGNFISIGGANSTSDANNFSNGFNPTGMTVLKDPDTGLLVDANAFSPWVPQISSTRYQERISAVGGVETLSMIPIGWAKSGSALSAGFLRGLAQPAELLLLRLSAANAIMGGGAGNNLTGYRSIPLTEGSYRYFHVGSHIDTQLVLASDNPEFW
ncbi:hypothetical protein [Ectopseudomonas toyotomiensis]|uniref:hypothetical protein n=1 Tax=Ectopseudomonas toyotomiensis TaxID=554344 RepID=UPI003D107E33